MNCNNWNAQSLDFQMRQQNRMRNNPKVSNRFSCPHQIGSKTKSRRDRSRKIQTRRKGPASSSPRCLVVRIPLMLNSLISHKEEVNSYLNISLIFNEEYIFTLSSIGIPKADILYI